MQKIETGPASWDYKVRGHNELVFLTADRNEDSYQAPSSSLAHHMVSTLTGVTNLFRCHHF